MIEVSAAPASTGRRPRTIADADPRVAAEYKKKLSRRAVIASGGSVIGIGGLGGAWLVLRIIGASTRGFNKFSESQKKRAEETEYREYWKQKQADERDAAVRRSEEAQAQRKVAAEQQRQERIEQEQRRAETIRRNDEAIARINENLRAKREEVLRRQREESDQRMAEIQQRMADNMRRTPGGR